MLTRILSVAIAYVMQKTTHVFPIIGGRKVEQLEGNIEALNVSLSDEQVKYLESILPFEPGFPHNFVVSAPSIRSCRAHRIYAFVDRATVPTTLGS